MNKLLFLIAAASVVAVDAGPFLFNALMTFSHMNLSAPLTRNIADLRSAKSEHPGKSIPVEYNLEENEERNEATPGIFQKTVTKILQKLQFLAQLVNSGGAGFDTNSNATASVEEDSTEEDVELMDAVNATQSESGRFSLTKVFESVLDVVMKMG